MNIVLVEDEQNLAEVIQLNLELENHSILHFNNGKDAMESLDDICNHDLLILDVMLPNFSGWEICEAVRKVSSIPILFMSAKGNSDDRIKGLKLGADDYLPKPFDLEELLLRVSILLKRNEKPIEDDSKVTINGLTVNFSSYEIYASNKFHSKLSKREVELLKLFKKHEGEVVARDLILDELWGKDQFPSPRTIDNYILGFRKIFETNPKYPEHFHSIRGVGYKFMA